MKDWKYINGAEVGNASSFVESAKRHLGENKTKSDAEYWQYIIDKLKKDDPEERAFVEIAKRELAKTKENLSKVGNRKFKIVQETQFGRVTICEWEADTAEQAVKEFIAANPAYANGKRGHITANKKACNAIYSELNKDNKRVVIEEDGSWYVYDKNGKIIEQGRESNADNAFGKFKAKGYNKKTCNQDGVARMFEGLVKDENKETEKDSGAIEDLEKVGNATPNYRYKGFLITNPEGYEYVVFLQDGYHVAFRGTTSKAVAEDWCDYHDPKTNKPVAKFRNTKTGNTASDDKFAYVMREFDEGKLKTPDGKVVTNPEQAKAIAYSESKKAENGLDRAWEAMKDKH